MVKRKVTRQIKVGNVKIGGGASVSIQSMTKVPTSDVVSVVKQVKLLESAGCEIIRVAVKSSQDAESIRLIKRKIKIPIVADIHFDHRLALSAISNGADKIRVNPGNMRDKSAMAQVVRAAAKKHIPIRIGVNSGSVGDSGGGGSSASSLVKSALNYVRLFETLNFHDIIISLKASDVVSTVEAYRKMSELTDHPLHLGVTAAGPYESGIVRSSVGIGALLLDGIGDTVRVSLTAGPVSEVAAAKNILSAAGVRNFGPEIISCPTCGRCQVNLAGIVERLGSRLRSMKALRSKDLTIAVMGCEVNGPGEAKEADIGIAFGRSGGMIFKKGRPFKKVSGKDAVKELLKLIA